jgi:hypothetical protein
VAYLIKNQGKRIRHTSSLLLEQEAARTPAQPGKRKFKRFPNYLTSEDVDDVESQEEDYPQLYMGKSYPKGLGKDPKDKGKRKKGKPGKGGFRDHRHRHVAPQLSSDGPKGKGKGKMPSKGKGKAFQYGNRGKEETSTPPKSDSGASSHTSITCGFCHKIGHTTDSC